jgi:ADP-ribose pyrophosphatase YjhB (NUDIX family)
MGKTKVIHGPRLARQGKLRLGCSAVIFQNAREKVLLTRRSDNGLWCLPGGAVDAGETVAEACQREVMEETGLEVKVLRLIGIYSDPDRLVVYPDGNKVHIVGISFEAQVIGGALGLSDETTEAGYFSIEQIRSMEVMAQHQLRIEDALSDQVQAFIR